MRLMKATIKGIQNVEWKKKASQLIKTTLFDCKKKHKMQQVPGNNVW